MLTVTLLFDKFAFTFPALDLKSIFSPKSLVSLVGIGFLKPENGYKIAPCYCIDCCFWDFSVDSIKKDVFFFYLFMIEREGEAETQAEGEAGSMYREPDVGFDPRSPGSHPGPKAGAKPLRHPGIPL